MSSYHTYCHRYSLIYLQVSANCIIKILDQQVIIVDKCFVNTVVSCVLTLYFINCVGCDGVRCRCPSTENLVLKLVHNLARLYSYFLFYWNINIPHFIVHMLWIIFRTILVTINVAIAVIFVLEFPWLSRWSGLFDLRKAPFPQLHCISQLFVLTYTINPIESSQYLIATLATQSLVELLLMIMHETTLHTRGLILYATIMQCRSAVIVAKWVLEVGFPTSSYWIALSPFRFFISYFYLIIIIRMLLWPNAFDSLAHQ